MTSALLDAPPVRTLDILLDELGDISTSRIVAWPAPGTATEADCISINERLDGRMCELVDGTLVEKAMGLEESVLANWISCLITVFVAKNKLGKCSGEQGLIALWPGHIRIPDIAYFSWANIRGVQRAAAPIMVPDLVVEILSPGNTLREIERKRKEFFQFGAKLFWTVDPVKRIVEVHTSSSRMRRLDKGDTLTGGKVLPGFAVPLAEIFDYFDEMIGQMKD